MACQICFLCDATSSMSPYINQVKDDIKRMVSELRNSFSHINFEFSFVGYRDWCDGAKQFEFLDFTNNENNFKVFVQNVAAQGGGDAPEDVLGGIKKSLSCSWNKNAKARIIFHTLDAPPHNKKYHELAESEDTYPNGHANDPSHESLLSEMFARDITYLISQQINCGTISKMIKVFQQYSPGPSIRIVSVNDVKDLLKLLQENVSKILLERTDDLEAELEVCPDLFGEKLKNETRTYEAYVAIDFGTDGSGFCWCDHNGDKIVIQQYWSNNKDEERGNLKKRTAILLTVKNIKANNYNDAGIKIISFGEEAIRKYLNRDEEEESKNGDVWLFFDKFKMALYEEQYDEHEKKINDHKNIKLDIKRTLKSANGIEIASHLVFEAALRYIKERAMYHLNKELKIGINHTHVVLWILTVPAIWSNQSKQFMEQCAKNAGMINHDMNDEINLRIEYEPVCAMRAIHYEMQRKHRKPLIKGDKILVIDLGGGTADICAMEFIDSETVQDIHYPDGGPWGSSYIDKAFFSLLGDIVGEEKLKEIELKDPKTYMKLQNNFRRSKECFGDDLYEEKNDLKNEDDLKKKKKLNKHNYHDAEIEIPGEFLEYFEENFDMDEEQLQSIFKNHELFGEKKILKLNDSGSLQLNRKVWEYLMNVVVDKIVEKLNEITNNPQLKSLNAVYFVGGLSCSSYVRYRIMELIKLKYNHEIFFESSLSPILSVVEGAIRVGQVKKEGSKHKRHYGVKTYKNGKEDYFEVLVKKGDLIKSDAEIPHVSFKLVGEKGKQLSHKNAQKQLEIKLYSSESDIPPQSVQNCRDETPNNEVTKFDLPNSWVFELDRISIKFKGFNDTQISTWVQLSKYGMKKIKLNFQQN